MDEPYQKAADAERLSCPDAQAYYQTLKQEH
jgi:hypothetical protein